MFQITVEPQKHQTCLENQKIKIKNTENVQ